MKVKTYTAHFPSPQFPKSTMHTNTFQSRFKVGEKVWYNTSSGIREDIVIDSCDNGSYQIQNSLLSFYTEDQLFPTAEACRAAIKVIPLSR